MYDIEGFSADELRAALELIVTRDEAEDAIRELLDNPPGAQHSGTEACAPKAALQRTESLGYGGGVGSSSGCCRRHQRLSGGELMTVEQPFVGMDPESGRPLFARTQVAVSELFKHLAGGGDLLEFLKDFPDVSEKQAQTAVQAAGEAVDLILRHPERLRGP